MQTIIMNFYVKIASDIVDSWALWQNNLFVKLGNTRLPRFVRDTSLNIDERTRKTLIKNIYIRHNLKYLFFFCLFFIYSLRILLTRMMSHSLKFRFFCDVKFLPLKHTCNFPFTLASLLLCLLNKRDFWLTQTWKLNFTSFFILTLLTSEWKCTHYWHYRYNVISKKYNTSVTQIALIFWRHFLKVLFDPQLMK